MEHSSVSLVVWELILVWLMFQIRSLGFALILIGVNYLIFKERELGEKASEVEKYVNEAVEMR